MLLQFRMLSDEDDNFLRDYQFPPQMTLSEVHDFISDDLKYERENMTSFFTSDEEWNRLKEYTYMDLGLGEADGVPAPASMADLTLTGILKQNCRRLIYQFDVVGDRAYYLELTDAQKDKEDGPRVLLANGAAPDQFDAEASPSNRSIFDEVMSDFDNFDGDESYADDE